MCGKARMEFVTSNGPNISGEAAPIVILVTDGLGEGKSGHGDHLLPQWSSQAAGFWCTFCPLLMWLAGPSMVVVRRYTNTLYILWGSSCLLYLDVSTLSGGASSAQFPLDWLHLCKLLPFSDTECGLASRRGRDGVESVSPIPRGSMAKLRSMSTASLIWFHFWSPCWPFIHVKKRAPRQREDWAFTQASSFYKMPIKLEHSWNVSWSRKHRSWLEDMKISRSNRPGGTRGGGHRWLSLSRGIFSGEFSRLHQVTALVHFLHSFPTITWAEWWPPPHNWMRMSMLYPSLRVHWLQALQPVQLIHPELHHFQYLPYWISPL